MTHLAMLERRPEPTTPRPYHFPTFERQRLASGLTVIPVHVPGRPLLAAELLVPVGAASEPAALAGVSQLMARASSEGTRRRDANAFIEATERLGASISAGCSWEATTFSLSVPRRRFEPALALLAEMATEPAFPDAEVERLRAQRINELLQARADPGRRAERAFAEAIYAPGAAYRRPLGGDERTVPGLDAAALAVRHDALLAPGRMALVVAGDLTGIAVADVARRTLGPLAEPTPGGESGRPASGGPRETRGPQIAPDAAAPVASRRVVLVDRPGSAQSEIRIGHVGLPRRVPDYHAIAVMTTILGGLFNSRLQRLLREERGYTYHVGASFAFRRAAGPFAVRSAVQTEVTAPAIRDVLDVLGRMADEPPTAAELAEARDFLVGVFPLRFEGAEQVAAAVADLVALDLPDDELDRYRPAGGAVAAADVVEAAGHLRPTASTIVLVGDAAAVRGPVDAEDFGPLEIVEEPPPASFAGE
jgi:predicted Zn-dependent peptidase